MVRGVLETMRRCLQEARSSLMAKTGLLPLSDPQVREQLHELNQPPEGSPPPPIPPPPPDLHSDSSYTFELATVVRKTMKGKRIETDTRTRLRYVSA